MKLMADTAPFYRRGKPRELTVTDYATIAGIPYDTARKRLNTMCRKHQIKSEQLAVSSTNVTVYRPLDFGGE